MRNPLLHLCYLLLTCCLVQPAWAEKLSIKLTHPDARIATNTLLLLGEVDSATPASEIEQRVGKAIEDSSRAYGHYQPSYHWEIKNRSLFIVAESGPPVLYRLVDIRISGEAAILEAIIKTLQQSNIKTGKNLDHTAWEALKKQLLTQLSENSFLDSHIDRSEIRVNRQNNTADAVLVIDGGQPYTIGEIQFLGSKLEDDVLQALSPEQSGKPARRSHLVALHKALAETGYFSSIRINSEKKDGHLLDISVELADKASHLFETGIGYGTDTGMRFRFNWLQPVFNPQGDQWENSLYLSPRHSRIESRYKIPTPHPLQNHITLGARLENRDYDDSFSRSNTLSLHHYKKLNTFWQQDLMLDLSHETYSAGSASHEEVLHLVPSTRWQFLSLDHPGNPEKGLRFWLDTAASAPWLGSETDFLKLHTGLSWLYSFGEKHQLISRASLGAVLTPEIDKVPVSFRFFTGGDQSVRGYAYESISPKDALGESVGGKYLNTASIEYNYRFHQNWRFALFTDIGRAYNNHGEDMRQGAGIGFRWMSPVGQIKTDLAKPISDTEENSWRIHFSIGLPI